jgi:hypothetical protein
MSENRSSPRTATVAPTPEAEHRNCEHVPTRQRYDLRVNDTTFSSAASTTKSALAQRNISFWVCPPMAQRQDQPHLPMGDRYNGENDHQAMVSPYRQE